MFYKKFNFIIDEWIEYKQTICLYYHRYSVQDFDLFSTIEKDTATPIETSNFLNSVSGNLKKLHIDSIDSCYRKMANSQAYQHTRDLMYLDFVVITLWNICWSRFRCMENYHCATYARDQNARNDLPLWLGDSSATSSWIVGKNKSFTQRFF